MFGSRWRSEVVPAGQALAGRPQRPYPVPERHAVLGTPLEGPWPEGSQVVHLAMGCFWGAERTLWQLPGVVVTAVGYMGGTTPNPTYEETCTSLTGHTEAVRVVHDPRVLPLEAVLRAFWEHHDPTQGYRQGNDVGTQYRSAVYWDSPEQEAVVRASAAAYGRVLAAAGFGAVTTELRPAAEAGPFYLAEEYHQQYLHKVPHGYCPDHGTGVSCPVGAGPRAAG